MYFITLTHIFQEFYEVLGFRSQLEQSVLLHSRYLVSTAQEYESPTHKSYPQERQEILLILR
jgi:hypothetical protein